MQERSRFPGVFWVANSIEIFERFAYYGIYMSFSIYALKHLGFTEKELGNIQSWFLIVSYTIPFLAGTFADKYGFKKVLIISYLAYLPSVLMLLISKTYNEVAFTMISIAFAAGIFKPLISGTIRVVTDQSNKTLGFGIFYMMVNIGGSVGPIVAGQLRIISWKYAFIAGAFSILLMFIVTLLFYKEPERQIQGISLKSKLKDIWIALSDVRFSMFLVLLGVFFWTPFWAFINLLSVYVNEYLDTALLYEKIHATLGSIIANSVSGIDETTGIRKVLGESISHTGYIIVVLQFFVSYITEKRKPIPTFLTGILMAAIGFIIIGYARNSTPVFVFLGILLFAIGEMTASPRIQEYITWLAPKEKAGLYMGSNFLAIGLGGGLSGFYTRYLGCLKNINHVEYVWYILCIHCLLGIIIIWAYTAFVGTFKEQLV